MVYWKGRKGSENVKEDTQLTTFEENFIGSAYVDYMSDDGAPLRDSSIPRIDFSDIPNKTTIRKIDRMLSDPELVDTRIREYQFHPETGGIVEVPTDFLLDSFKRAREVGLPVDWTSFKKEN